MNKEAPKLLSQGEDTSALTPILLDGGGRSGTTLVMQLLASCSLIAFDRGYPYEHRYLLYIYKLSHLWGLPKLSDEDWSSAKLFSRATVLIGPPPWDQRGLVNNSLGGSGFSARCFHALWTEFSRAATIHCMDTYEPKRSVPKYYAEKAPNWLASEIRPLISSKVIYLIRDTRDVWLSALAFNRKRGYDGFGIEANANPEINLRNFINGEKARLARINYIKESDSEIVLRYEDLIGNFHKEVGRLENWLGVELAPNEILENRSKFGHHVTTPSAEASLERWKIEMSPDVQAEFAEKMGQELKRAGYEVL